MHLLLIEDERDLIGCYEQALREQPGIHITAAGNGAEALRLLRTVTPDAILLDLMMPIMNGWEFLEALTTDHSLPRVPVFLLSAYDEVPVNTDMSLVRGRLDKMTPPAEAVRKVCAQLENAHA